MQGKLRFGEFVVTIEFCSGCSSHNGSLRHNEKKYFQKASLLKEVLANEFPFLTIILKPLQKQLPSKLGCFEVTFKDFQSPTPRLVASKLKTLKWPETKVVVNNLRHFMKPKTLRVGLEVDGFEGLSEVQQTRAQLRCLLISEVDFPCVVDSLKDLQSRGQSQHNPSHSYKASTSPLGRRLGSPHKSSKLRSAYRSSQGMSLGSANFRVRASTGRKQRVLSAIVVKKLRSGETRAELIKHLLENKPCVAEKSVARGENAVFKDVHPGRYRFIVLKDFNFKFAIQEVLVGPNVRPNDCEQRETVGVDVTTEASFEVRLPGNETNPIVKTLFTRVGAGRPSQKQLKKISEKSSSKKAKYETSLEPGVVDANEAKSEEKVLTNEEGKKESAEKKSDSKRVTETETGRESVDSSRVEQDGDLKESEMDYVIQLGTTSDPMTGEQILGSSRLRPGIYCLRVEFNDYREETFEVEVFAGMNKLELSGSELAVVPSEEPPRFLDHDLLSEHLGSLRLEDFYKKEESIQRYSGEIPRMKRSGGGKENKRDNMVKSAEVEVRIDLFNETWVCGKGVT